MATTTNYGWTTPDNTAYVKDGASAIRTLGSSVDTSLFNITSGKNVGMVLLDSRSFTGASTVTVDNIFTSAYRNYKVVITNTSLATSGALSLQFRAGGTTTAGTAYSFATRGLLSQASAADNNGNGVASIQCNFIITSPGVGSNDLTIYSPQLATQTFVNSLGAGSQAAGQNYLFAMGGMTSVTTQFDGLIFTYAGNATGVIRIYGLRD
jgi:hypothetical protein